MKVDEGSSRQLMQAMVDGLRAQGLDPADYEFSERRFNDITGAWAIIGVAVEKGSPRPFFAVAQGIDLDRLPGQIMVAHTGGEE